MGVVGGRGASVPDRNLPAVNRTDAPLPPAQQWLGERRPPAAADGAPAAEETNPLLNVSNRATVRWRASRCYESDTPTYRCGTHASVFNASLSSSGSASRRRAGVSITNSQSRSGITRTLL